MLRSLDPLRAYPQRFTEYLARWAHTRPDTAFLAQRSGDGNGDWRKLTYADAYEQVRRIADSLLQRGLSEQRPLMILSANSIDHALLTFAALHVGVPVAPVSPAYSLLDPQTTRVQHAVTLLTPGLVYAEDAAAFERAIAQSVPAETEVVVLKGQLARTYTEFASLLGNAGPEVDRAHQAVNFAFLLDPTPKSRCRSSYSARYALYQSGVRDRRAQFANPSRSCRRGRPGSSSRSRHGCRRGERTPGSNSHWRTSHRFGQNFRWAHRHDSRTVVTAGVRATSAPQPSGAPACPALKWSCRS